MAELRIPTLALVVLVGASGSGKSTFARQHFKATEVLSADACRGWVSDDENDQAATRDAFEVLHFIAARRLARGRLAVVDATNVQASARKPLLELARRYHALPVAIVFDLPEKLSLERNRGRPDRAFGSHVVRRQLQDLRRSLRGLDKEGFRRVHLLRSPDEVDAATIVREPLYSHKQQEHGPFDLIGDVHGCFDELALLLERLGYQVREDGSAAYGYAVTPPDGRAVVFLGDLVDRGPKVPQVLRLVMSMVATGAALCVPGNHEAKLLRALNGRNVQRTHGLPESLAQIAAEPPAFTEQVKTFIDGLTSHYVLDDGRLVVAHAGLKEEMHGRGSGRVRDFALYGETTGETDEYGLPVRYPWAQDYRGKAMVVYGHTPVVEPQWLNNTLCLDTGCVFGGRLTALRYPEKKLVSVPAARVYYEPLRPLAVGAPPAAEGSGPTLTTQQEHDDLLDLADVLGRRVVTTRLMGTIVVAEDQAAAALEVMSRFAADPRWLVYLPPTMSPAETSTEPGLLERVRAALASSGLWDELGTDWMLLDAELLPWSAKALELVRHQYAAVGAAASAALSAAVAALQQAGQRGLDVQALLDRQRARADMVGRYIQAYRRYCWPVKALEDLKLAPFHLLATEGAVHGDKDHVWHMEVLARACRGDERLLLATPYRVIALDDPASEAAGVAWWQQLTGSGGEGMVVKPIDFVARNATGRLVQPALKCRGQDYLRLVYGPEYTAADNLERLRARGVGAKRALAAREFALGLEGLERFIGHEPLRRVHECAFGVLALESEPVDPRL